jgi:hypothetical protein
MAYLLAAPADTDARDERTTQPRSDVLITDNSRSPSRPRRGEQRPKRYEFLERALMAREMAKL